MNFPKLYDERLDDVNYRQKVVEELLCALMAQKVNGKHVQVPLTDFMKEYGKIERLLGNEVGV